LNSPGRRRFFERQRVAPTDIGWYSGAHRGDDIPLSPNARRKATLKLNPHRPERSSHFQTLQSAFCFAAVVFFCGSSIAQSTSAEFDPWQGIEKDGRIPKIEKPADLTNPERWRYIPEGRLKPGNVFQRFLVSSFVAPFLFRDSDVGFGGGIAITDLDFRQQRRREFAGIFLSYTTEGQQAYQFAWRRRLHHREIPEGGVLQEERSFIKVWGGYEKSLTRRFFGFGAKTKEEDETSYRDETAFGRLGFELAVPDPGDNLVIGASIKGEWHSLGKGEVNDRPNTEDPFPLIFARGDDHKLGWLELELRYDTRDSQRMPYRGFAVGATVDSALLQTGWDVGSVFAAYGTQIFPVPPLLHSGGDAEEEHPPTDTLAFHLQTSTTAGDLPFYSLPTLGGNRTLRGFIEGRFRDRSMWHASGEYRFWVLTRGFPIPFTKALRVERVGLAFFGDVGSVADDWPDIFSSRVWASGGVGLRITLERDAPFRVDVGFSKEGVEVSAGFGLAF
jgi:hypothetical protein